MPTNPQNTAKKPWFNQAQRNGLADLLGNLSVIGVIAICADLAHVIDPPFTVFEITGIAVASIVCLAIDIYLRKEIS